MSKKNREILKKQETVQAVLIADCFEDEFIPITNDTPIVLLPLLNKPIINYTLESLLRGGVEEIFLFCRSHSEAIKNHVYLCKEKSETWATSMKINIIVSESCHSFGDCMRDLDHKGMLRGDFILVEAGTICNMDLAALLKKHQGVFKKDKGNAMTLVFREVGAGYTKRNKTEHLSIAVNDSNRILFYKPLKTSTDRSIKFPKEIFLNNPCVSLHHSLKNTHIAICSPSVLPLFSDNFDYQTMDDFVRGLLMNEEILGSTMYAHIVRDHCYGSAVTNWQTYQFISNELRHDWIRPHKVSKLENVILENDVVVSKCATVHSSAILKNSVISENVTIGQNVRIQNSFIFPGTQVDDNVVIHHSIIGENCHIKTKGKVTKGSVLGKGVIIEDGILIENNLIQSVNPRNCDQEDVLGQNAFRLRLDEDGESDKISALLAERLTYLHIDENGRDESDDEDDPFAALHAEEELSSNSYSPPPDDTKLFFAEVVDSLTRGFEDQLQCENLILEINSSRYAYNISLQEVNVNVVKAILHLSFVLLTGSQYYSQFSRLLSYFSPILKNYIRNKSAMKDNLEAIEDIALSEENMNAKWIMFVLKWFYDNNYITEDVILEWAEGLDKESVFYSQIKPFIDWLQEAEEESSSDESD